MYYGFVQNLQNGQLQQDVKHTQNVHRGEAKTSMTIDAGIVKNSRIAINQHFDPSLKKYV